MKVRLLAAALLALGCVCARADNPSTALPVVGANRISKTAWTPADGSGASLTFANLSAMYVRDGDLVTLLLHLTYPTTSSSAATFVSGLPFVVANSSYDLAPGLCFVQGVSVAAMFVPAPNSVQGIFVNPTTGANLTNANLSGATLSCSAVYSVN